MPTRTAFLGRAEFVDYLERYARSFAAPVREGVDGARGRAGRVAASGSGPTPGPGAPRNVVIATGHADEPFVPGRGGGRAARRCSSCTPAGTARPRQLPPGGVLVVGAGPSGQQIAAELRRAGRDVVLAVGPPRADARAATAAGTSGTGWTRRAASTRRSPTCRTSATARRSPSLRAQRRERRRAARPGVLPALGVAVTGRLKGFSGRHALFADDLQATVGGAERRMRRVLEKDRPARRRPPEGAAARRRADPCRRAARGAAGARPRGREVSTVIWATGYRRSYPWLNVDVLGADGELVHQRGVTAVSGLYALGLRFQHRRKSHFIGGVGEDASSWPRC